MVLRNFLNIICLFIILQMVQCIYASEDESDVFVATKEWKVVPKGQKIPKGLHVRINFKTGITEAKILEETKTDKKYSSVIVSPKNNILDGIDLESVKDTSEFRSYKKIKEEMSKLNIQSKTEFEVIDALFEEFENTPSEDEETISTALDDMEYFAHQYDNALWFVKKNGFDSIIYRYINMTNSTEIRKYTLILLGSLLQNNPSVKVHALETGSLSILINILNDKDKEIKHKAMYALGALLRQFPYAQLKFLKTGGFDILIDALQSDDLVLRLKVVNLFSDLIVEHKESMENVEDKNITRLEQYNLVDIKKRLLDANFCEHLINLVVNLISANISDTNNIKMGLDAILLVADDCKRHYIQSNVVNVLRDYQLYESGIENDNEFMKSLEAVLNQLIVDRDEL